MVKQHRPGGGKMSQEQMEAQIGGTPGRPRIMRDAHAHPFDGSWEVEQDDPLVAQGDEVDRDVFYDLVEGGSVFADDVSVQDVLQGDLGDCWLLSALAALAAAQPDFVQGELIQDLGGGQAAVTLYWPRVVSLQNDDLSNRQSTHWTEGEKTTITVDQAVPMAHLDGDSEALEDPEWIYAHSSDTQELWPALVEKAVADLLDRHGYKGSDFDGEAATYGGYGLMHFGNHSMAWFVLTGNWPSTVRPAEQGDGRDYTRRGTQEAGTYDAGSAELWVGDDQELLAGPVDKAEKQAIAGNPLLEQEDGLVQGYADAEKTSRLGEDREFQLLARAFAAGKPITAAKKRSVGHVVAVIDVDASAGTVTTYDQIGGREKTETWAEFRQHYIKGWNIGRT